MKWGYKLNLENPQIYNVYNEKLVWIKLNDRNHLIPRLADKYLVRQYTEEHGYGEHLPKLYWNGFSSAYQIPFDIFTDCFVIKVTSSFGGNILVRNKGRNQS